MTKSIALSLILSFAGVGLFPYGAAAEPQAASPHPVVAELITEGFAVGTDDQTVLTSPVVSPTMSPEEQEAAITKLFGGERRMRRYMVDSIVAPQVVRVKTAKKVSIDGESEKAAVRRLDLYFIVHGDLEVIRKRGLMKKLFSRGEENKPADDDDFEDETPGIKKYAERRDKNKGGEEADDPAAPYVYRYRFPILDRVVIAGLLRGQSYEGDGVLIDSTFSDPELLEDEADPSVWQSIPRGAENDAQLGPEKPFPGLAGYLQATQLKFADDIILIEAHAVLVEPHGWFDGRNLLASKLPIAMQDNVRKFRAKLRKALAEAKAEAAVEAK